MHDFITEPAGFSQSLFVKRKRKTTKKINSKTWQFFFPVAKKYANLLTSHRINKTVNIWQTTVFHWPARTPPSFSYFQACILWFCLNCCGYFPLSSCKCVAWEAISSPALSSADVFNGSEHKGDLDFTRWVLYTNTHSWDLLIGRNMPKPSIGEIYLFFTVYAAEQVELEQPLAGKAKLLFPVVINGALNLSG